VHNSAESVAKGQEPASQREWNVFLLDRASLLLLWAQVRNLLMGILPLAKPRRLLPELVSTTKCGENPWLVLSC